MLRKTWMLILLLMGMLSCTGGEEFVEEDETDNIVVTITNFETWVEPFQKGTLANDCSRVTLAVFDEDTGEKVYDASQTLSIVGEKNFGKFSFSLSSGNYRLLALGYKVGSATPVDVFACIGTMNEASMPEGPLYDTFSTMKSIRIASSERQDITMNLNRIVSRFVLTTLDDVPPEVSSIRVALSGGGKLLNPSKGLAVTDTGMEKTVGVETGDVASLSLYLFLTSDEESMDVDISAMNRNGVVLYNKKLKDILFHRNSQTIAKGSLFSESSNLTFTVSSEWDVSNYVTF